LPRIVIAILVLVIGFFVIKYLEKALTALFNKTKFDEALERFIQSFVLILAKIFVFVIALLILGAELGAFAAAFGAMVFAVGMALQGSLSNFAGGVLILFFKPFRIGDYITSGDYSGKVTDIQIFNTILETPDGKKIILPNGPVSNETIVNHTDIKYRRLDLIIGIDYSDNIKKAKKLLTKIAEKEDRIIKDKKDVKIVVNNLGDNAVEILFRA
jgi:small conductance mechanosensitive channel